MMLAAPVHADAVTDKLKATLSTRLDSPTGIKSIGKSPIPGLYEVNLGHQILYSDATGNHVLLGDMIDTRARKNVTEVRLAELNRVDFNSLPFQNAIKVVRGDGSRRVAQFSDPRCPYCRQVEQTLRSIDNVTIYTFLYPVLSDASLQTAKAIWCSVDKVHAWESWMNRQTTPKPPAADCDTGVLDANLQHGRALNVTGTPTLIFASGLRVPGAVTKERIEQELSVKL